MQIQFDVFMMKLTDCVEILLRDKVLIISKLLLIIIHASLVRICFCFKDIYGILSDQK